MEKIVTHRKNKIIKIGLKQLWSGSLLILLLYFHVILLTRYYSLLNVLGVSIISLMRSNIFPYIVIILTMSLKSG